jgi:hypothetical protein
MSTEHSPQQAPDRLANPSAVNGVPAAADAPSADGLRCQWCFVPLAAGTTICPTCGSPGVPDPRFTKPEPEPAVPDLLLEGIDGAPVIAPWRDDDLSVLNDPPTSKRNTMTFQEAENRQMRTIVFAAVSILVCAFIGWLAGPLLAGTIESFTGTPVENTGDLRPMGAFFGLLTGFFIGGLGGVVIWAGR